MLPEQPTGLTVTLDITLKCYLSNKITLPIKSWGQIKSWFITWDVFHYTTDGEIWHEVELNNDSNGLDWCAPFTVNIMDEDKQPLASR